MNDSIGISTHVLDTSLGAPAQGIPVTLRRIDERGATTTIMSGVTNADGRVVNLAPSDAALPSGGYRLRFDVAGYFAAQKRDSFYDEINIDFRVGGEPRHYHVPLLLSPFGYATYRGS